MVLDALLSGNGTLRAEPRHMSVTRVSRQLAASDNFPVLGLMFHPGRVPILAGEIRQMLEQNGFLPTASKPNGTEP